MEMPKGLGKTITIYPNGTVRVWVNNKGSGELLEQRAVPVPKHGRPIDADALYRKTAEWEAQALHMCEVTMNDEDASEWRKWSTVLTERSAFKFDVADAPTIIPADKEGEG
jgi:hypothetical protein